MQKVLKIAVPVFVGGLSGLAVLALLIAGFSAGGAETNIAASASPSATPSATASSPEPSPSVSDGRTCSVAELAADPRLGNLQAAVVNLTTDELLFDRNAAVAASPASVMKTLTGAAALMTLGPNYRVETRVYSDPLEPGTIILVGAGDPTLTRLGPGQQSVYYDAAKLSTLAIQVNAWAGDQPINRIILDSTMFPAPSWEATWERSEQTQGYMSEVTALQVDGDRNSATRNTSPRSNKPVLRAGKWFKEALGEPAFAATIEEGVTPSGAVQIASVKSQPISRWIKHMLLVSDNTEAEFLARLVALDEGFDGSFKSIDAAFKKALGYAGLDTTGLVIRDGSGLSDKNAVSPLFMTKLMKLVYNRYGDFEVVLQGLPVAAESGSLASRFKGENIDAAGKIFAKTGWIKTGYTLSGIIEAADGTTLSFAVYALGSVQDNAKEAIDNLVTGFYRCGDKLSNG